MFTATRPSRTSDAIPESAPPVADVDMDRLPFENLPIDPELARLVERHGLPLVVLDIGRAARQYRAVREAFATVDVHYDVSALAHPALIAAIDADGGYFEVAHDGALAALTAAGADLSRALHATAVTHPHALLAAYNAGVRRFIVDGPADVEKFVGYPADLRLIVRLRPASGQRAHVLPRGIRTEDAPRIVRFAASLGVRISGFSLNVPDDAAPQHYVAGIARTIGMMADIEAATGIRFDTLDLGDAFPGRAGRRAADRAELAKAIRAIVSPATSRVSVTASASRAVTAGCITIVAGTVDRDADPLVASDCIDQGANVAIVGADEPASFALAPFFRAFTQPGHRTLRTGRRGPQTGSSAG
jgi:ornithine decarboxylase